ncbi:hypothetical protein HY636_01665 [Candidatus Woesearchaeota archaeon]|nr:hypothetical protein [Candidatus Woesearchaeota archaeon]
MFYAIHMILAHKCVRIKSVLGIHKITAQAFLYFCVKNNYIAKELYKQFIEIQKEASELLNFDDFKEKAKYLSKDFLNEYDKISRFTYETTEDIKQIYAVTSLKRAKEFFNELKQVVEK